MYFLLLLLFLISIACLLPSAHANTVSSSVNTINEYPELDDNIQTQLLLQFVNSSLMGHSSKACV